MDGASRAAQTLRPSFFAALFAAALAFLAVGCGSEGDPFGVLIPEAKLPVLIVAPPDRATGVSVFTLVTIAFPTDLDPRTVGPEAFALTESSGLPVARTVTYDASSRVVTIRPDVPLKPTAIYQTIVQGVRTKDGILFSSGVFTFGTGDDPAGGAPEVISIRPVPNQASVNPNSTIVLEFSEPMDRDTVFRAFSISGGVSGVLSFDATDRILTFTPGAPMPLGITVQVQVSRVAVDKGGTPLRVGFASSFTTPARGSFAIVRSVPAANATTAAPGEPIVFTFSEPVDRSTVATNFQISNTALAIPAPTPANFTFANNDQVVIYDPTPSIPGFVGFPGGSTVRTTFTVNVLSAVSGIGLERPFRLNFTVEQLAPQVVSTVPTNGAVNVPARQVIRFRFNEAIDRNTVDATSFSVVQGPPVSGTISFEDSDRTIVFTPAANYQTGATPVSVTAGTQLRDLGGTPLAAAVTISFSVDNTAPILTTSFPVNAAQDVPVTLAPDRVLRFVFNEPLDQAATIATFAIAPDSGGGVLAFQSPNVLVYTPPTQPLTNPPTPPNRRLLTGATNYTVTFTAIDQASNATPINRGFRTDDDPPLVGTFSPVNTSSATTTVAVVFNELLNKDTVAPAVSFRQILPVVQNIPVTPTVGDFGFSFAPPTLVVGRTYEVTVAATLRDLGGVAFAAPLVFQFLVQ